MVWADISISETPGTKVSPNLGQAGQCTLKHWMAQAATDHSTAECINSIVVCIASLSLSSIQFHHAAAAAVRYKENCMVESPESMAPGSLLAALRHVLDNHQPPAIMALDAW